MELNDSPYGMKKPDTTYYCSLRVACKLYNFGCNSLDYLCDQFKISYGQHHWVGGDAEMCARLFLTELNLPRCRRIEEVWKLWRKIVRRKTNS